MICDWMVFIRDWWVSLDFEHWNWGLKYSLIFSDEIAQIKIVWQKTQHFPNSDDVQLMRTLDWQVHITPRSQQLSDITAIRLQLNLFSWKSLTDDWLYSPDDFFPSLILILRKFLYFSQQVLQFPPHTLLHSSSDLLPQTLLCFLLPVTPPLILRQVEKCFDFFLPIFRFWVPLLLLL